MEFQSTHPRGVRRSWGKGEEALDDFNPRTHVGCDGQYPGEPERAEISIHAPTWGATQDRQGCGGRRENFNPRTHVGCDEDHPGGCRGGSISIHAPTWGATQDGRTDVRRGGISIHAPTWGATNSAQYTCILLHYFNPRTHVGCDFSFFNLIGRNIRNFNPRTHVGCDMCYNPLTITISISIHAPTWGATAKDLVYHMLTVYFNPRTHVGCDC